MGITASNKTLSAAAIECGGSFRVQLSLAAEPNILTNPTDIVLVLDRSGSMSGSALANLKNGAKAFIDRIAQSTQGQPGQIGSGSRIAVVSFADAATQDTGLTASVSDLKAAVDALSAGGDSNHADALAKAQALFQPASSNARVMVLFTDGQTTAGDAAATAAAAARAAGTVIYAVGLSGDGGVDEAALESWASTPAPAYVVITPDDAELEDLFDDLAQNTVNPGATNIVINDTISDCFRITALSAPTRGTASLQSQNTVLWQIPELGVTESEGAVLEFTVEHVGPCSGTVEVNESISFDDAEGNVVSFPSPTIDVDCGVVVVPEPCPQPVELTVSGCGDTVEFDAGLLDLGALGRILQLSVTLQNVCPGKRVALAAILSELNEEGEEVQRGLKVLTVPAHTSFTCQAVTVRCITFVLPQDETDSPNSLCGERRFRARFIAHYIDNGFVCCDQAEN